MLSVAITLSGRLVFVGYNCSKCPGYCCSYPVIPLSKTDVQRLADHFDLGFREARKKFTKVDGDEPYAMRRKRDVHYGGVCRFFDSQARRCTIYTARPAICRQYPGASSCGYFDFLRAERNALQDPAHIASTWNK
jgi:Fe-S-cluster containining protein